VLIVAAVHEHAAAGADAPAGVATDDGADRVDGTPGRTDHTGAGTASEPQREH
jgi:hypothetical protein